MSHRGKLILVTGAARSGKSYFAEQLAASYKEPVTYIATCIPGDDEMVDRVAKHRARRPTNWETIEEGYNPQMVIKEHDKPGTIFLLDCVTLLISNLLLRPESGQDEEIILQKVDQLVLTASAAEATVILVTNEVGWGIVPDNVLAREYRDIIGRANQIIASYADEVYLTIAGIPVELKSLNNKINNFIK